VSVFVCGTIWSGLGGVSLCCVWVSCNGFGRVNLCCLCDIL
jgi:hypothetical protein